MLTCSLSSERLLDRRELVFVAIIVGAAVLVLLAPVSIAIIGGLTFVAAASRRPLPALCCIILTLPILPLPRTFGHFEFSPTEILIVLSAAAATLRLFGFLRQRQRKGDWNKPSHRYGARFGDQTVAALAVLLVLAAVASLTASVALHQSLQSFRIVIVEPVVFFGLILFQARGRRDAQILTVALIVAGASIALIGLSQYVTGDRIITAEAGLRRIRGFYGSPNNLALFLGRTLPITVAGALWWPRGRNLLIVASGISAVALILTFSIGAWVAVVLSLIIVAYLHGSQTLRYALGIVAVGLGCSVVVALEVPRIGSHLDFRSGTSSIRIYVWRSALQMIADHPIRGIGLDNFLTYYENGYRFPEAWEEPSLSHPHNLLLDFWLSLGLAGPLLLGCLLARLGELIRNRWERADRVERGLYAGVVGAMADTVFHGLVDNSFFLPDLAVLFWLMFAIVCVVETQDCVARSR